METKEVTKTQEWANPQAVALKILREPFEPHQISKLPKPFKKDSPKGNCPECGKYHGLPAAHLDYVGHAALTNRLLDADPMWTWEPLAFDEAGLPRFDKTGGLWIKLTVAGLSRFGYGHAENSSYKEAGAREKEIIGDALRNAAMRFGAALDLWHKGDLNLSDEEDPKAKSSPQSSGPKPTSSPTSPIIPKQSTVASIVELKPGEYIPGPEDKMIEAEESLGPVKNMAPTNRGGPKPNGPATPNPNEKCTAKILEWLFNYGLARGLTEDEMNDILKHRTGKITWDITNFEVTSMRNAFDAYGKKDPKK